MREQVALHTQVCLYRNLTRQQLELIAILAPVLELGRILAQRGHRIEFATHRGQEKWVSREYYRFISAVHTMGECMTAAEEAAHYVDMQASDPRRDYWGYFRPKLTVDAFWRSDFAFLKDIVATVKPDMLVADFFVDATVRVYSFKRISSTGPHAPAVEDRKHQGKS